MNTAAEPTAQPVVSFGTIVTSSAFSLNDFPVIIVDQDSDTYVGYVKTDSLVRFPKEGITIIGKVDVTELLIHKHDGVREKAKKYTDNKLSFDYE